MEGLDVKCPNCRKVCFVTTDQYDPAQPPNGGMVKSIMPYSLDWLTVSSTPASQMSCPECECMLVLKGQLLVVPAGSNFHIRPYAYGYLIADFGHVVGDMKYLGIDGRWTEYIGHATPFESMDEAREGLDKALRAAIAPKTMTIEREDGTKTEVVPIKMWTPGDDLYPTETKPVIDETIPAEPETEAAKEETKPSQPETFDCPACERTFRSAPALRGHMKMHPELKLKETEKKP